jgi:hypothetical protein
MRQTAGNEFEPVEIHRPAADHSEASNQVLRIWGSEFDSDGFSNREVGGGEQVDAAFTHLDTESVNDKRRGQNANWCVEGGASPSALFSMAVFRSHNFP